MGYDLYSQKEGLPEGEGYFRWNIWYWPPILSLAHNFGWQPAGTVFYPLTQADIELHELSAEDQAHHQEIMDEWTGEYDSNSGQIVTTRDALNMAVALERALLEVPDEQLLEVDGDPSKEFLEKHRQRMREGNRQALLLQFSGKSNKDYLKSFIEFLRHGCFQIS